MKTIEEVIEYLEKFIEKNEKSENDYIIMQTVNFSLKTVLNFIRDGEDERGDGGYENN